MEPQAQPDHGGYRGPTPNRQGRIPGSKEATAKDIMFMRQQRLFGRSDQEIADMLQRPKQFVTRTLANHERAIKARLEGDIIEEKRRQVERLDYVVEQSARGWAMSKGEDPDEVPGAAPEVTTPPRRSLAPPVKRPGELSYLREMRSALADQRTIFGIGQTTIQASINLSDATELAERLAEQREAEPEQDDDTEAES